VPSKLTSLLVQSPFTSPLKKTVKARYKLLAPLPEYKRSFHWKLRCTQNLFWPTFLKSPLPLIHFVKLHNRKLACFIILIAELWVSSPYPSRQHVRIMLLIYIQSIIVIKPAVLHKHSRPTSSSKHSSFNTNKTYTIPGNLRRPL
jgi:hypothetical protein